MIRKIVFGGVCMAGLMWPASVDAQKTDGNRNGSRREIMVEKRAERLAGELKLDGESRAEFLTVYKNYQQELMRHRGARSLSKDASARKNAELTEEEAAECIKAEFDRKAQQIVDAYNALEVQKKYYEIFSRTLSAKQLMKVFVPEKEGSGRYGGRPEAGRGSGHSFGRQHEFTRSAAGMDGEW